jgi:hypothetical protein
MDTDASLFPYGYQAELEGERPCRRKLSEFGWEVHRQYMLYDGRPGSDLSAVYATEAEAIEHERRVVAALKAGRAPGR